MMSTETIQALAREAMVRAVAYELEPYVPASTSEVYQYERFPFPDFGDYRPQGWTLVDWAFVDSSGMGSEGEPAMTGRAFRSWVAEWVDRYPDAGFAILQTGQFQVYVGAFTQADNAPPKEGFLQIAPTENIEWFPCSNCGTPLEVGTTSCDCGWDEEEQDEEGGGCGDEPYISPAFSAGMDAFLDAKSLEDNPHTVNSDEYLDWEEGYKYMQVNFTNTLAVLGQMDMGLGE